MRVRHKSSWEPKKNCFRIRTQEATIRICCNLNSSMQENTENTSVRSTVGATNHLQELVEGHVGAEQRLFVADEALDVRLLDLVDALRAGLTRRGLRELEHSTVDTESTYSYKEYDLVSNE